MTSASHSSNEIKRVASLDLGSNSVLMLVAERDSHGQWVALEEHETITRLSQGLESTGEISEEAIERTGHALRLLMDRARTLNVQEILATGTAPFRRAVNGDEAADFLSQYLDTNKILIVSGEEEAFLGLQATKRAFPTLKRMVVIDIGGASTEIVLTEEREPSPKLASLNVGTVVLTERFISRHPISAREQAQVRAAVQYELGAHQLSAQLMGWDAPMIATAGTVTTLAALSLELAAPNAAHIHGHLLHRDEIHRLCVALCNLTTTQCAHLPGIPKGRADVIATGALILDTLVSTTSASQVHVSTHGIRWGRLHAWDESFPLSNF
jgi:exopolyphosphatase/guanosine-5'-triphosphate,3'-diphosphate pyrophosphatase